MTDGVCDSAEGFHPASAPDYLPSPQLRDLQLSRLQASLRRAYDRVPLFRKRMEERGFKPDDLQSLDDISRLPFTVKTDLRDTYPFGLFASPMREVVRLHASSGTTGKPIVVGYTREDVDVWTSVDGPLLRRLRAAARRHHPERATATACSPAASARITARRRSAPRSSPSPAATPTGRSWS